MRIETALAPVVGPMLRDRSTRCFVNLEGTEDALPITGADPGRGGGIHGGETSERDVRIVRPLEGEASGQARVSGRRRKQPE